MVRLAWCTDIHLDCVDETEATAFAGTIRAKNVDGVIISGDVSTAPHLLNHLSLLERVIQRPVYFVLGNHDFYHCSDMNQVRYTVKNVSNRSQFLRYLPNTPYIQLTPDTALIGADGWYDARLGNPNNPEWLLNDFFLIDDYVREGKRGTDRKKIIELSQRLAHDEVMQMHNSIKAAHRYCKRMVIVSHVPPFAESHIYEGHEAEPDGHPWFTCKAFGDMLMDASKAFPETSFLVLTGHTHGGYRGNFGKNLEVVVGGAEYRRPRVETILEL
jgi:hypothetical protein